MRTGTLEAAAERLAALLTGRSTELGDPLDKQGDLVFDGDLALRPLVRGEAPADVWAVDGGQALVLDARCVSLLVTRSATVRYQGGSCVLEEEGDLRATLLGLEPTVDANLVRDSGEWEAV